MAEQLLHHLRVNAGGERQRRAGMPGVMQPDHRDACAAGQGLEQVGETGRVIAGAVLADENQPGVGVRRSPRQPLAH